MTADYLQQIFALTLDAVLVGALVFGLHRLRPWLGLTPLYVAVGSFQFLQTALASSIYVEVGPNLFVSPGSVVLFAAGLAAVLLVYLEEGAIACRRLIAGLLAANISLALLAHVFSSHLSGPHTLNLLELPVALFVGDPRILVVGTVILALDVLGVIVMYEFLGRFFAGRATALRLAGTLAVVLAFDAVAFATLGFVDAPMYESILVSGLIGKVAAGCGYGLMLAGYLRWLLPKAQAAGVREHAVRDPFTPLSFRERYERLKADSEHDPLTGTLNREALTRGLEVAFEHARRDAAPISVLMIDVNHFKRVNDTYGHAVGDEALVAIGAALMSELRDADLVGRYGGEEFVAVLPDTGTALALAIAERLRRGVRAATSGIEGLGGCPVSVTIGHAEIDLDRGLRHAMDLADRRLYHGKQAGRDRVVGPMKVVSLAKTEPRLRVQGSRSRSRFRSEGP